MHRWMNTAATAALLGSVFGLVGCGSDDTDEPTNHNPAITALTVDREAVITSGRVHLTAEATDPDGDSLVFSWVTDLGELNAMEGEGPITWTAPGERGLGTVTVLVDDGHGGTAEESIEIGVVGWSTSPDRSTLPVDLPFNGVSFISPEEGWIAGGAEGAYDVPYLYHYLNGGWADETQGTSGHLHALSAVATDDVWAAGGEGLAYHWDGAAWAKLSIPGGCIHGMTFLHAGEGWVTPAHTQPYMRRYSGGELTAWDQYELPSHNGLSGVSMVSETDGWAVGSGGLMFRFDGTAWTEQPQLTEAALQAVRMISADDGWAVGVLGVVLHWDGAAWTPVDAGVGTAIRFYGVDALDSNNVWIVGSQGTILFWDGEVLTPVPSPVTTELHSVSVNTAGDAWIAGYESTILHLE